MTSGSPIRILSETPIEQVWSYLTLWESETAARRLIDEKARRKDVKINDTCSAEKARGVAYCLRNARECLCLKEEAWIPRIVSKYYGTMWLLSAIMIADPASPFNLQELERYTKMGHGLGNIVDEQSVFPASEYIYLRESGFFPAYLKFEKWTKTQLLEARPTKQRFEKVNELEPADREKLVSLEDLLQRIPELAAYYTEVTGRRSMTAHVFHSTRNMAEKSERDVAAMQQRQPLPPHPGYTWIGIGNSKGLSEADIASLRLPLTDWSYRDKYGDTYWEGKLPHDADVHWGETLKLHHSAMAPSSWIAPFPTMPIDYLSANFMLLYGLSILTRYRPRTWREVVEGQFDAFRPLVSLYVQVVDRVLPQIALEKVSGRTVVTVQPGSIFAPI